MTDILSITRLTPYDESILATRAAMSQLDTFDRLVTFVAVKRMERLRSRWLRRSMA